MGKGKREGRGFKEDGGVRVGRGREGGRVWERDFGTLDNNHYKTKLKLTHLLWLFLV